MPISLSVWFIQGILMLFDEFYFHYQRPLQRWERIGHPLDTLFFLSVFVFSLFGVPTDTDHQNVFIGLSVISCLLITKDEWVHTKLCAAGENWLHAMLFIIHPISLMVLYRFWQDQELSWIKIQTLIIGVFLIYQILYWNIFQPKETHASQNK